MAPGATRMAMLGPWACRTLISCLGIALPAARTYRCAKREIDSSSRPLLKEEMRVQSAFWLAHWTVICLLICFESCAEWMISWAPLYFEAKFVFILWLVLPHTRGTSKVYTRLVSPFFEKWEPVIDSALRMFGARAAGLASGAASGAAAKLRSSSLSLLSAGTDVLQMVTRAEDDLAAIAEGEAAAVLEATEKSEAALAEEEELPPTVTTRRRRSTRTPSRAAASVAIDALRAGDAIDFCSAGTWRSGTVKRVLRASNTVSVAWGSRLDPELTTVTLANLARAGTKSD